MNPCWQEFLATKNAQCENGSVADFGHPAAEFSAAREAAIIAPLSHLGLIECTGDDAKSFLHNQLTSDVNHLTENSAQHSAWCTAKGRMLASFILYRHAADFRALLSADLLQATLKRLKMFVLRSKVSLSDLSETHELIGLAGPKAAAVLSQAGLPEPLKTFDTAVFAAGKIIRLENSRFIVVVSATEAPRIWDALATQARPAGTPIWHWLDIQTGIPLISEATKEEFVPQMANFDKIGGVSFNKGCYPGQEIVARAQYLGKIKRHLYRIHATGPILSGSSIFGPETPEHPCGMVANAAPAPDGGYDALAVIQEGFVDAGSLFLGKLDGEPISVTALT
ncbi:MAG: folate-binding protein YgfZ [Betaproteobacteria bacterium]